MWRAATGFGLLLSGGAAEVAAAARQSLVASQRIRACCLGEGHPLTVATAAAAERAGRTR